MKFGQTLVSVFRLVDVIDTITVWGEGIRHLQETFRDGKSERRILIVLFDNLSIFREFGIEDDAVQTRLIKLKICIFFIPYYIGLCITVVIDAPLIVFSPSGNASRIRLESSLDRCRTGIGCVFTGLTITCGIGD